MNQIYSTQLIDSREVIFSIEEDLWINATKLVKEFPGKRLDKFWSHSETQEYIQALIEKLNEKSSSPSEGVSLKEPEDFKKIVQGKYTGTYYHPKLSIIFGRYLSANFAVSLDLFLVEEIKRVALIREKAIIDHKDKELVEAVSEAKKLKTWQLLKILWFNTTNLIQREKR